MLFTVVVLVLLIPILAIVLDSQVGKAIAGRLERRNLGAGEPGSHERLAHLEGEVERLGRELERLDEEGRFLHKLLAGRRGEEGALPPGDRSGSARDSGS